MVQNYMEILVDEIFQEVRSMYNNCNSEECIENIKSKALNKLPPMYFTTNTLPGTKKAYLLDRQRRIAVLAKVAEAADEVCGTCGHNLKKEI